MSTLPEKAIKGNRKAMIALYESNKDAVYSRACELLGDGGEALVYVFKTVWNDISKKKAFSEEKFAALVLEKTEKFCRKQINGQKDASEDKKTIEGGMEKADAEVMKIISDIAVPYETSFKKNIISAVTGAMVALVLGTIVIIALLSGKGALGDPNEITHYADIVIEDYGTVTVALYGNAAPKTVKNFVSLAKKGFYDGLTFHRIMAGFMMQGGCPDGTGGGDSGKHIKGEFAKNGFANNLKHTRGAISMARGEEYDSASCQFFIVHEDSTFLDGAYAAFGYVTEGIEVVDKVCADARPVNNNGKILPENQPGIKSITIRKP